MISEGLNIKVELVEIMAGTVCVLSSFLVDCYL